MIRDRQRTTCVEVAETIPAEQLEPAWELYNTVFAELRSAAVQRHLMFRAEFDEVMYDGRVEKFLSFADGRLNGLATLTNRLEAMPLISPDYFERRWPRHYAERRIWYVGFLAVHPDDRGGGTFTRLAEAMYPSFRGKRALIAVDVCRRNERIGLPKAIQWALARFDAGVRGRRVDEQSYWLYELTA